jgi:glyoxylase-like metal-dependent hydrolase (beta-lactamase superfamily II)
VTAGYLLTGPAPVLVETGSQSSVPALLEALAGLGLGANDLAGVAVTHIHLDHAGGVGDVARAFPSATVYVHGKGARHLIDPTRLVDSAARVYGPPARLALRTARPHPGRADPRPRGRRGDTVGPDRVLVTVDSPGHAKHHLALHDSASGILFAGDAVGVRLPDAGVLRPVDARRPTSISTRPSIRCGRFAERRPAGLALAHYGLVPDPQLSSTRPRRH